MGELSAEEMLEIEADRRRRVSGALRLGTQRPQTAARPTGLGALAAGLAIAVGIALVLGVIAVAQGTGSNGGASRSPAPIATPTR
jgi:hypothetical protein